MTAPTPPGWYPDPYGAPGLLRWWDGELWTDQTHPDPSGDETVAGTPSGPQNAQSPSGSGPTATPWSGEHWGEPSGGQAYTYDDQPDPYGTGPGDPYGQADPYGSGPGDPYGSGPGDPYGGQPGTYAGPAETYSGPAPYATGPGDPYGVTGAPPPKRGKLAPLLFGGIGALAVIVIAVVVLSFTGLLGGRDTPPTPSSTSPSPLGSSPTATGGADRVTDSTSGVSYARPSSSWTTSSQLSPVPGTQWSGGIRATAQRNYINGHDWVANVFTGQVTSAYSGTGDLKKVTKPITQYVEANFYPNTGRKTLQVLDSKSVTIDGHDAWLEKFKYTYKDADSRKLNFKSETAGVLSIDRPGKKPAVLFVTVPDNFDTGIVDRVLNSIKVDG